MPSVSLSKCSAPNVPRSAEESGKVTEVRLSGNMYKGRSMSSEAILGLSILMSFIAFSIVTRLYIWPKLLVMRREDALIPLVVPHTFRFVGLSFLVPGVVSPSLSAAFAKPAAYGDLAAAVLAVVAILALVARASWAIPIVWVFNLWGTVDLLHAIYQGQISVGIDPRFTRSDVLHPDTRCPTAFRYAWADILAATAAKTIQPPARRDRRSTKRAFMLIFRTRRAEMLPLLPISIPADRFIRSNLPGRESVARYRHTADEQVLAARRRKAAEKLLAAAGNRPSTDEGERSGR